MSAAHCQPSVLTEITAFLRAFTNLHLTDMDVELQRLAAYEPRSRRGGFSDGRDAYQWYHKESHAARTLEMDTERCVGDQKHWRIRLAIAVLREMIKEVDEVGFQTGDEGMVQAKKDMNEVHAKLFNVAYLDDPED